MKHETFEDENYQPSWEQIISECPEIIRQDAEEMEKIDKILAQLPPVAPLLLEKMRRQIEIGAKDHFLFRMNETEQAKLKAAEGHTDTDAAYEIAHDIAESIAERAGINLLAFGFWMCERLDEEYLIAFRFDL